MHDYPDEQVAFAALRGPIRLEDALFTARKSNRIAPLQVVRHDRVLGAAHIRSAALHANRAQAEGRMHAKSLEVEFVRYLAGERQISDALAKMGLPDSKEGSDGAVVVALGPKRMDALQHFVHTLGLVEDDGLAAATPTKLSAFGVTKEMLDATTPGKANDVVLEMVAAVDLMR
ncbi:MAG: KEOPS complex subunit Cgi121 [bacterium]